jgi:hypothetical protein
MPYSNHEDESQDILRRRDIGMQITELEAEYDRRSDRGLDTFEISEEISELRGQLEPTVTAA